MQRERARERERGSESEKMAAAGRLVKPLRDAAGAAGAAARLVSEDASAAFASKRTGELVVRAHVSTHSHEASPCPFLLHAHAHAHTNTHARTLARTHTRTDGR